MTAHSQLSRHTNPKVLRGAALCVRAAAVKAIAGTLPQGLKAQLVQSADETINTVADEYCGTGAPGGPPHVLNPWAGPSVLGLELASVIIVYANTRVQPGPFQAQLTEIAGLLVKKAYKTDGSKGK
jgi:hypothetical protein